MSSAINSNRVHMNALEKPENLQVKNDYRNFQN